MKKAPPLLVLAVALVMVIQTVVVLDITNDLVENSQVQGNAASANVGICINRPPVVGLGDCGSSINQSTADENNTYSCQLNYSVGVNETINFSSPLIVQNGLDFSVNRSGTVTIWANQSGIGLFAPVIVGNDGPSCPLSDDVTYVFQIFDINDPPEFYGTLPGIQVRAGTQNSYALLSGFFDDADDDPLSYSVSGASKFSVSILPSSEVVITNPATNCEDETIYFIATDPYNATGSSNPVTLDAICDDPEPAAGGGGGGGLGCLPEWKCHRWSQCYPNGTRSRLCVDLKGCDLNDLEQLFTEACVYSETCFDGIQNQDETGIDCGGVCPACPVPQTCFDGVKNQGETGVDCGGPCDECFVEPTCFDGVKNQGETGVDCGGPCEACREIHVPGLIEDESTNILSAALITLLVLAALFISYILFRKEIKSAIAKAKWRFTRRKRKQILIDEKTKSELLKIIIDIEKRLQDEKLSDVFSSDEKIVRRLLSANRLYFVRAFNLSLEFNFDEMMNKADIKLFHVPLKNIFKSFMDKQTLLETKKIMISRLHFTFMVEELKQIVLATSSYSKSDSYSTVREYSINGNPLSQIVKLLHNSMIALQFREVEIAENRYLQILSLYELLSDKEKSLFYDDISRLYNHINYEISWV